MLSQSFRWRVNADSAFLDYNAGNVAHVQRWRDELVLTIRWQGHTVGGRVGSVGQGVRYAERWIAARPGWPGKRPKRWYDVVDEQRRAAGANPGRAAPYRHATP